MTHQRPASPFGTEMLDDPAADPGIVRRSLHHIARSNAWFGGWAAVRFGVRQLIGPRPSGPLTVLDLGAGFGDLSARLLRWGRRAGAVIRPIGLELHPAAARVAADNGLPTVRADGLRLPLRDRGVDLVLVSQVAHHLGPADLVRLAREATRVARIGVVIADLARSEVAVRLFQIGSWLLRFDPITRADGMTSVRRGFRRVELETILREAGCVPTVTVRPFARIVATWGSNR